MRKLLSAFMILSAGVATTTADAQVKKEAKKEVKTTTTTTTAKTTTPAVAKPAPPAMAKPAAPAAAKDTARKKMVVKKHKVIKKMVTQREQNIELDNQDGKAVVEIKEGNVYVNGDLLSTIDDVKKENHRITINIKDNDKEEKQSPQFDLSETPVRRAMLGVYTDLYGDFEGARVNYIIPNSPADDAGLMNGDIITYVGGRFVRDSRDLTSAIADHEGGERVSITYERHGREFHTIVELANAWPRRKYSNYEYRVPDLHGDRRLPSPYLRSYRYNNVDNTFDYTPQMGISAQGAKNGGGVVVLEVQPNSPAEAGGLQSGDLLLRINHLRTTSVDDIQDILDDTWPNQRISVQFKRDGVVMTTYVRFTKEKRKRDL